MNLQNASSNEPRKTTSGGIHCSTATPSTVAGAPAVGVENLVGRRHSRADVCRTQGVQSKTLKIWLDRYLHGGFTALFAPLGRARAQTLSPQRRQILRFMLLQKTPKDYGIDAYQWTAVHIQQALRTKWEVSLSANRL